VPGLKKVIINGGKRLCGTVEISGAKNAAVAIIPAVILADGPCTLENLPDIMDVRLMLLLMKELGAKVEKITNNSYRIDATEINKTELNEKYTSDLRASYYYLGALLGKKGKASVASPGGCNIGNRPIDQHVKGFKSWVQK